jgi:effector-binding domain-containing protein
LPGYEQVASTIHKGKYDTITDAYQAMLKWIEDNGYNIIGLDRGIYRIDPNEVKSPEDNVTEIQFPIARASTSKATVKPPLPFRERGLLVE